MKTSAIAERAVEFGKWPTGRLGSAMAWFDTA